MKKKNSASSPLSARNHFLLSQKTQIAQKFPLKEKFRVFRDFREKSFSSLAENADHAELL